MSDDRDVDKRLFVWVVAGLVVTALFWIDPLFIPLALLGPIVAWWIIRALVRRRAAPAA